jgi:peptidoglycan/LPS O-acetylase OafA/YrhL
VLVILVHTWAYKFEGGTVGVYLFFGLSGFLITGLLLSEITVTEHVSFGNFYARRALRLLPAIVAVVCVVYLASRITAVDASRIQVSIPSTLFYYANWARSAGNNLGMLSHTWSLSIEEQFYLIWPLIFWVAFRQWRAWGVLGAALLGALVSLGSMWWLLGHHGSYLRRFDGFDTNAVVMFVGCALAAALHLGLRPPRLLTAVAATAAAAFVLATTTWLPVRAWTENRYYGLTSIAVAGACMLCFLDQWPTSVPGRILALRPIAYIGRISYGLYLWHYLVLVAVIHNLKMTNSFETFVVVSAISLPVAALSYRFLEAPFLFLQRYFRTTITPDEPARPESDATPHETAPTTSVASAGADDA